MNTEKKINKIIEKVGAEAFKKMGDDAVKVSSPEIATRLQSALTTSVKNGLDQQIALITVMEHVNVLNDEYSFMDKGSLEFGIGETFLTTGFKKSKAFNQDSEEWVPNGAIESLDKYQATCSGFITRRANNQYTLLKMKEFVRDANTFNQLVQKELEANTFTKSVETRECKRYLFGLDSGYLPTDYKTELDKVKTLIGQNKVTKAVTSAKEVIEYLRDLMPTLYKNISNKYNMGSKTPGGNIDISGDTGFKALDNTWTKENTVLVLSTKLVNRLKKELGNTYNPAFWNEFKDMFGLVIEDTFDVEGDMFLFDKRAIRRKIMFEEYSVTYYPKKLAYDCLGTWRETYQVIPWLNGIKLNFTGLN